MLKAKYNVSEIRNNIYAIEEKSPLMQVISYLVVGNEKALLIDTGSGLDGLFETVNHLTDLPVIVVNTHAHVDHIGKNHYFNEIWFHKDDKKVFSLHTDFNYVKSLIVGEFPAVIRYVLNPAIKKLLTINTSGNYNYFEDGHIFHLGGKEIEVIQTAGHTPGSVCLLDRDARILFTGDTVCEWGILLNIAGEACTPQVFLDSMKKLKRLDGEFDILLPGHHGFPCEKEYIDEYLTCAEQVVENTATLEKQKGRLCAKFGRILIFLPSDYSEMRG